MLSQDELVVEAGIICRRIRRRSYYICVSGTFSNSFHTFVVQIGFKLNNFYEGVEILENDSVQCKNGNVQWVNDASRMTPNEGRQQTEDEDERMKVITRGWGC